LIFSPRPSNNRKILEKSKSKAPTLAPSKDLTVIDFKSKYKETIKTPIPGSRPGIRKMILRFLRSKRTIDIRSCRSL